MGRGGDGRTALRGGAGIAHDYINHSVHLNTSSVSPFRLTVNSRRALALDNPWATYRRQPVPVPYDARNPVFPAYGSYLPLPSNLNPTTQYSWNVGVQRQMTPSWFASATYIGPTSST